MKQFNKQGYKNKIGALGEQIVINTLQRAGYVILEQNYLKPWGEIDIVCKDCNEKVHFIEVKTVSYETKAHLFAAVSRATWRPEENVHRHKLIKVQRTIETWLSEQSYQGEWQIDVWAVRLVSREKYATFKKIENVFVS
jgi:putative endonuclease